MGVQGAVLGDRFTYLDNGVERVGRGRHLLDHFELGAKAARDLDRENGEGDYRDRGVQGQLDTIEARAGRAAWG